MEDVLSLIIIIAVADEMCQEQRSLEVSGSVQSIAVRTYRGSELEVEEDWVQTTRRRPNAVRAVLPGSELSRCKAL